MVVTTEIFLFALIAACAGQQRDLGEIGAKMVIRGQLFNKQLQKPIMDKVDRVFIQGNEPFFTNAAGEVYSIATGTRSNSAKPPPVVDFTLTMAGKYDLTELDSAGKPVANFTVKVGGDNQMRSVVVGDIWFVIHRGELYTINKKQMEVYGNVILAQRIPAFGARVVDVATDVTKADGKTLLVATNHASGSDIWRLSMNDEDEYQPACIQPEDDLLDSIATLMEKVENDVLNGTVSPDAALSSFSNQTIRELKSNITELEEMLPALRNRSVEAEKKIRNEHFDTGIDIRYKREALDRKFCAKKTIVNQTFDEINETYRELEKTIIDINKTFEHLIKKIIEQSKDIFNVTLVDLRYENKTEATSVEQDNRIPLDVRVRPDINIGKPANDVDNDILL